MSQGKFSKLGTGAQIFPEDSQLGGGMLIIRHGLEILVKNSYETLFSTRFSTTFSTALAPYLTWLKDTEDSILLTS